jgi:Xaa-Pro aminopeptidase
MILVDWGARVSGYHSDLTRTFFAGTISVRLRKVHEVVREAQRAAIAKVAPGVRLAEVDKAARNVIAKAGYGKQFGHSTGHGVGLNIHEAPSLSARAKGKLKPGMVVTVEPGIYLPGVGGVRIEDDVLVTARGHRVLSRLRPGVRWNGAEA